MNFLKIVIRTQPAQNPSGENKQSVNPLIRHPESLE